MYFLLFWSSACVLIETRNFFIVHVSIFSLKDTCVIMLIMNIFMFSVSLLLAFHHVHLHHLYSLLHFEQSWLAS